jgi:hypothetical protein
MKDSSRKPPIKGAKAVVSQRLSKKIGGYKAAPEGVLQMLIVTES